MGQFEIKIFNGLVFPKIMLLLHINSQIIKKKHVYKPKKSSPPEKLLC